jgi:sulfite exporter TauE/SafE
MSVALLLLTAGSLGLLGGLHCVGMCSALQRFAVHGTGGTPTRPIRLVPVHATGVASPMTEVSGALGGDLAFHAARAFGYASLGAAVGAAARARSGTPWQWVAASKKTKNSLL